MGLRAATRDAHWAKGRLDEWTRAARAQHQHLPRVIEGRELTAIGTHQSHRTIQRLGEELGNGMRLLVKAKPSLARAMTL
jgi:hypothetical protein